MQQCYIAVLFSTKLRQAPRHQRSTGVLDNGTRFSQGQIVISNHRNLPRDVSRAAIWRKHSFLVALVALDSILVPPTAKYALRAKGVVQSGGW